MSLPSLETLLRVGGKDYAEVNMPTLISTATQVNLIEEKVDEEKRLNESHERQKDPGCGRGCCKH